MENLQELTTEEYNNIPVYYCPHCLSLKIKAVGTLDFCDDCGCTDIETCQIEEWQEMYRKRFNKNF